MPRNRLQLKLTDALFDRLLGLAQASKPRLSPCDWLREAIKRGEPVNGEQPVSPYANPVGHIPLPRMDRPTPIQDNIEANGGRYVGEATFRVPNYRKQGG